MQKHYVRPNKLVQKGRKTISVFKLIMSLTIKTSNDYALIYYILEVQDQRAVF